jgi:5-methylcytosine-specific restriction endonuclease McrA
VTIIPRKMCARCRETKPLEDFPKNRCKPDGYDATCKACRSEYAREYRLNNPERFARYRQQQVETNIENLRKSNRDWYARNREAVMARTNEWRRNNPEKVKAIAERRRKTHSDRVKAEQRKSKQRAYAADPQKFIERALAWTKQNPDAYRAIKRRRKARKRGSQEGAHSAQEWQELKARYDYRCLCCGKQEPEIELTVDHVVPVALGGSDHISNIQPLCRSCNSSKWTKTTDYR